MDLQETLRVIGLGMEPIDLDTLDPQTRQWADRFAARGYVYVIDSDESTYYVRPIDGEDSPFILGGPFKEGVELHLWDDFFNGFAREDFDTDDAYLDAVEARFNALWAKFDED